MEDRLKFRVWLKLENRYIHDINFSGCGEDSEFEIEECKLCDNGYYDYIKHDIKDCIIEQCTGLKDNNGTLIYHNDIVEFNPNKNVTGKFTIVWVLDKWRFRSHKSNMDSSWSGSSLDYEIISNIHKEKSND